MAKRFETKADRTAKFFRFLFSLMVAICLYFIISLDNREVRRISIPLNVVENQQFINNSNIPENIEIEILGDSGLIYNVNPDKIKAYLDTGIVDKEGIYDIPVTLSYEFGLLEKMKIEIVNKHPNLRISFIDR